MLTLAVTLLLAAQAPAPAPAVQTAKEPAAAPPTPAPAPALATAATPPPRPRILVLETRADAAYLEQVRAFGDLLATLLESRSDAEVIPSSSVKDRLSAAADRLSAGCDDTACMTEIAGALDARYVIASRASQVGGRWLMRVELFDSRDLKVIAQATAMADGVEGLAAQAELLADDIVARAPVIGRQAATVGGGTTAGSGTLPPPDAKKGGGSGLLLGGGIAALAASAVAATVGGIGFFWASGDERRTNDAIQRYRNDPNTDTRQGVLDAARISNDSSNWYSCLLMPIGCSCIPLGLGGAGAIGWSMMDSGGAEE
ncbi:MAG: hypothetical protein HYS27_07440 [Deltaproteobacteria bacterium]|nr:hypothetical protein [Deltaproteobacteria bacterium]